MQTANHSSKTFNSPETLTSTTRYKKYDIKISAGGQECWTGKAHLELPYYLSKINHTDDYSLATPNN